MLLEVLTTAQQNRFIKFLHSPYHNVNESITQLAESLVSLIRSKEHNLSRQEAYRQIFGDENLDDRKLRKLTSDLLSRFEDFLTVEQLNENKLLKHNLLIGAIQKSKLESIRDKAKKNAQRFYDRYPEKSQEYFQQKYELEKTIFHFQSEYEKRKIKKGEKRNLNINLLNKYLDQYYVIEKLRLACDLLAWQRIYKMQERPFDVEIILRMLDRNDIADNLIIDSFKAAYNILIGKDEHRNYFHLKDNVFKYQLDYPRMELKELFDSLLTFCIGHLSYKEHNYIQETLELYDFGISSEIIFVDGKITPITFRNYVIAALRLGQYERVERFIATNQVYLDESNRQNTVEFCLARMHWYKKEWKKVIQQLAQVDMEDSYYYYVNSKIMLVSAYYELEEFDALEYTLDAFYTFISRNKELSQAKSDAYKSYISYTKKLLKIPSGDSKTVGKLRKSIETDQRRINGKDWLLEKLEEKLSK